MEKLPVNGIGNVGGKKYMTRMMLNNLLTRCDEVLSGVSRDLEEARSLVGGSDRGGFGVGGVGSIETTTTDVHMTTGGHSNTDHVVHVTGNAKEDRIRELKRAYQRRIRSSQPEHRGQDRWDVPKKIPGGRRRRILREKDLPQAPHEPPPSGYIIFLGQMTTKIRHDQLHHRESHQQTKVATEVGKMWINHLTPNQKEYYNELARNVQKEYQRQTREYRATGRYQPSDRYARMEQGAGPWVHLRWDEKNGLERELATYDTVVFPQRPTPEMEEAYQRRVVESYLKRKEKLRLKKLQEKAQED